MQILSFQVWGNFHNTGSAQGMDIFKHTVEKATTLCSWLLSAPAIFMAHRHFEWTLEQKEEEKDPHFQWQQQHSTSLDPSEVQRTSALPAVQTYGENRSFEGKNP